MPNTNAVADSVGPPPTLLTAALTWMALCAMVAVMAAGGPCDVPMSIIIPAFVLVTILTSPIAEWLAGTKSAFDPICLLAVFGMLYFVGGPLYQVSHAYYPYVPWNSSVDGYVSLWMWSQVVLLASAFFVAALCKPRSPPRRALAPADPAIVTKTLVALAGVSLVAKAVTLVMFSGVAGMMAAYQTRIAVGITQQNPFAGVGPIVFVGDGFPLAASLLVLWLVRKKQFARSSAFFAVFLAVAFGVTLVISGLRGSRANVVYTMFLLIGAYYFLIRRFGRLTVIAGLVGLMVFMQGYLAYKFGGLEAVVNPAVREQTYQNRRLGDEAGAFVLIRDFTRMDVQALSMWRLMDTGMKPVWGRSLVGGVASIVPSALWPNRPPTFVKEKTETIFPGRTYTYGAASTLVFGFFGELMMNFGPLVLLLGVPLGWLLGYLRAHVQTQSASGRYVFVAPLLSILPVVLLIYDSNSLMYFVVQFVVVPAAVAVFSRIAERRQRGGLQVASARM